MRTGILLLVAVVYAVAATTLAAAALPGGWFKIKNITDPHVQELGEWAVAEHIKVANDGLRFKKVVSGEVQIVAGANYRLDVDALRLDGKDRTYRAELFEQNWPANARKLVSFDPAN